MLARQAENVCRHYLTAGKKSGNSWIVGNIHNEPGRSFTVCIKGDARKLGRWTDHSTGEYGDLLDLIKHNRGHTSLGPALAEARHFLGIANRPLPRPLRAEADPAPQPADGTNEPPDDTPDTPAEHSSRLLWDRCVPLPGSPGELYLHSRSIDKADHQALRFNAALQYREGPETTYWPAIVAALTDLDGQVLAVHRTWLDPDGRRKADLPSPRRMLGYSEGAGVRFRNHFLPDCDMTIGEGLETVLSILEALPLCAGIATLSSTLMPRIHVPEATGRILIAADRDPAGYNGALKLQQRLTDEGRQAELIIPKNADFNDDLKALGPHGLFTHISVQIRRSSGDLSPPCATDEPSPSAPEPIIALTPSPPSIASPEYRLLPLEAIDRTNLLKVTAFPGLPRPHQILSAASSYAAIAKIAADRAGATKVLILTASYMAAPLERALRERGLEPLHPYVETVRTQQDDGTVSTERKITGFIPACSD